MILFSKSRDASTITYQLAIASKLTTIMAWILVKKFMSVKNERSQTLLGNDVDYTCKTTSINLETNL